MHPVHPAAATLPSTPRFSSVTLVAPSTTMIPATSAPEVRLLLFTTAVDGRTTVLSDPAPLIVSDFVILTCSS